MRQYRPYPDSSRYPYIGVTGFTNVAQIRWLVWRLADRHEDQDGTLKPGRKLMVGVLVSDKTMRGEPNKWPGRFPPVEMISEIFKAAADSGDAMALRIAHFNTHDPGMLGAQLIDLYEIADRQMSGIQLNVYWPERAQLEKYREEVPPTHRVILQLGRRAMEGLQVKEITRKVASYGDLITDVLVDPSGGEGRMSDLQAFFPLMDAIQAAVGDHLGLGYAGGLDKHGAGLMVQLYQRYPDLSIDAEGRLRDSQDNLNLVDTADYVETAIEAIRSARQPREEV